ILERKELQRVGGDKLGREADEDGACLGVGAGHVSGELARSEEVFRSRTEGLPPSSLPSRIGVLLLHHFRPNDILQVSSHGSGGKFVGGRVPCGVNAVLWRSPGRTG